MDHNDRALLQALFEELSQIQQQMETLLSRKTAQRKALPIRSEEFEAVDALCDSLGYAVDDLDSVLGNLEELISED